MKNGFWRHFLGDAETHDAQPDYWSLGTLELVQYAAEAGDAEAQYNLGMRYIIGRDVAPDDRQAVMWLQKAAEQGNVAAQYNIGNMYEQGKGVIPDIAKALMWYRKAAEQGHKWVHHNQQTPGNETGYDSLVVAAELGDVMAQFYLGVMYYGGNEYVDQNIEQAVVWFHKAAEQGHARAQYYLGWIYSTGVGGLQDDRQAAIWCSMAAKQGDGISQLLLGAMYADGKGVTQNFIMAYIWSSVAVTNGRSDAVKLRDAMARHLPQNVLIEAQAIAAQYGDLFQSSSKA